ncbi:hypothetical protein GCM10007414_10070 [Agarivorans gilvus]|uniref:Uncharacterized protein n=1 Tax=Agarivorans gilvus TaxID=680279 RepID=A0ABQ1HZH4_9ALTE|nr:hypothetical protein GCM10007414_10070 [Agarivorans gilvus]
MSDDQHLVELNQFFSCSHLGITETFNGVTGANINLVDYINSCVNHCISARGGVVGDATVTN